MSKKISAKDESVFNRKKFKPKANQIDFTKARFAPVVNCVVRHKGKILIVKRSEKVGFYPNYWNGIGGFLDDNRTLIQKVKDELREELNINEKSIKSIKLGEIFHINESKYKKVWIMHPILVEVSNDAVKLDWEASDYAWISYKEIKKYKIIPNFLDVLEKIEKI